MQIALRFWIKIRCDWLDWKELFYIHNQLLVVSDRLISFTMEVVMNKQWLEKVIQIIRIDPGIQSLLLFTIECLAVFAQEAQFGGSMKTPISTSSLQVLGGSPTKRDHWFFFFQFSVILSPHSSCLKTDLSMLNLLCGRQSYCVP